MKIKAIYRKNLKMSTGKIAAQVAHAVKNLGTTPADCNIVVLGVSDSKFYAACTLPNCYIQVDKGLTEVEPGTETAAAWIEDPVIERAKAMVEHGKAIHELIEMTQNAELDPKNAVRMIDENGEEIYY